MVGCVFYRLKELQIPEGAGLLLAYLASLSLSPSLNPEPSAIRACCLALTFPASRDGWILAGCEYMVVLPDMWKWSEGHSVAMHTKCLGCRGSSIRMAFEVLLSEGDLSTSVFS